ncbi:MAG: hypothetical protein Q3M30_12620 [Candidatus Electrothrix sp. Rat3]|nr:hypothetical protein [Candidatus Electrothrix rattekaaiensis]
MILHELGMYSRNKQLFLEYTPEMFVLLQLRGQAVSGKPTGMVCSCFRQLNKASPLGADVLAWGAIGFLIIEVEKKLRVG